MMSLPWINAAFCSEFARGFLQEISMKRMTKSTNQNSETTTETKSWILDRF